MQRSRPSLALSTHPAALNSGSLGWREPLRRKTPLPIDKTSQWLIKAQDGRCPICQDALVPDDDRLQAPREWETWLATTRKTISKVIIREDGAPDEHEPRLIHVDCRNRSRLALLSAYEPVGLA